MHGTTLLVLSGYLRTLQTTLGAESTHTPGPSSSSCRRVALLSNRGQLFVSTNHRTPAARYVHHPTGQCSGCMCVDAEWRGLLLLLEEPSWLNWPVVPARRSQLCWLWWSPPKPVFSLTFVNDKIPFFGILCQSSLWRQSLGFILLLGVSLCRINQDNRVLQVSCGDLLKTKFTISLSELQVDNWFPHLDDISFVSTRSSVEPTGAFTTFSDQS